MKKERKMNIFFSYYMYKYWTIGPHCSTKQQLALSKYLTIYHLSPFGKRCDSLLFLSRDNLYQVWEKLAQWFWEDLNSTMYFHYKAIIPLWKGYPRPLEKGVTLMNKHESPFFTDILCQILLILAQWFWKMWKDYKQMNRERVDKWSKKLTWALSSAEQKRVQYINHL